MNPLITPEYAIMHNTKIKSYPLASVQKVTLCSKNVFRESGWELLEDKPLIPKPQKTGNDSRGDSVRRAKQKVYELAMLNRFDYFITWTLNQAEIDRYDAIEISRKLKIFLNNQQKRRNAKYIIIPEHHQDGAIHLHGLISGDFDMADSGHVTVKGQTVYNMPQWKYGFSTAVKLDDNIQAISRYITKYITKDMKKIFGNFYYAGGSLIRKPETVLCDSDYESVNAAEYFIDVAKLAFKYVDIEMPTDEYPDDYFDIVTQSVEIGQEPLFCPCFTVAGDCDLYNLKLDKIKFLSSFTRRLSRLPQAPVKLSASRQNFAFCPISAESYITLPVLCAKLLILRIFVSTTFFQSVHESVFTLNVYVGADGVPGLLEHEVFEVVQIVLGAGTLEQTDALSGADESRPVVGHRPAPAVTIVMLRNDETKIIVKNTKERIANGIFAAGDETARESFGAIIAELELDAYPMGAVSKATLGGFVVNSYEYRRAFVTEINGFTANTFFSSTNRFKIIEF